MANTPNCTRYNFWTAYGGFTALAKSPYLWLAMLATSAASSARCSPGWWDTSISVVSSLMGFTLAGFAILIAFGDESFRAQVTKPAPGKIPILLRTAAAFTHFIIVQVASLSVSLGSKFFYVPPSRWLLNLFETLGIDFWAFNSALVQTVWFVGFFLFLYTVTSTVAATRWLYELTRSYVVYVGAVADKNQQACEKPIVAAKKPQPSQTTSKSDKRNKGKR